MKNSRNCFGRSGLAYVLLMISIFIFCACSKVPVEGIMLNLDHAELCLGESVTIVATTIPSDAESQNIIWVSADAQIATVENGIVSAVSVGTTTITAKTEDGGFESVVIVTVIAKENFTYIPAKAAACTEEGNIEYWISDLTGKYYSDAEGKNEIEAADLIEKATGHTEGKIVCGEAQVCTVCSAVIAEALDHTFGEWNVADAPTESEEGSAERICSRDYYKETMVLPALSEENGYTYAVQIKPTSETVGKGVYTYTQNGTSFIFETVLAPVGHTYDVGVIKKHPTCTTNGIRVFTCLDCGVTYDQTIKALRHDYGVWTLATAPTFEQTGTLTRACDRVGCPNPTDTFTLPVLNKNDYALNEGDVKDVYTYTKDGQSFVFEGYEVTFVYKDASGAQTQTIKSVSRVQGDSAAVTVTAPDLSTPTSAGDVFDKWDVAFDDVTAHMTVTAIYKLSVLAENVAVALGADTVEVAISLRNAPKLSSLTFSVQYDNALLTLIGHEFKFTPVMCSPMTPDQNPDFTYNTVGKETISAVNPMTNMQMHDENGEMIVLTFEISDSVTEARDIDISLVWEENSNAIVSNGNVRVDVDAELLSGKISVQ